MKTRAAVTILRYVARNILSPAVYLCMKILVVRDLAFYSVEQIVTFNVRPIKLYEGINLLSLFCEVFPRNKIEENPWGKYCDND